MSLTFIATSPSPPQRDRSTIRPRRAVVGPPPPWVVPGIVALGLGCRIIQYGWNLSFWGDEASIVLNVRGKTAAQLLGPLDFQQAAPPLFLLAERGLFRLLGGSELSMRLLPILAGCLAILLFASVARRLLSPWSAAIAVALFCCSERLTFHHVEVKQYGTDVFIAVALAWIVTTPVAGERMARRLLMLRPPGRWPCGALIPRFSCLPA